MSYGKGPTRNLFYTSFFRFALMLLPGPFVLFILYFNHTPSTRTDPTDQTVQQQHSKNKLVKNCPGTNQLQSDKFVQRWILTLI